MTLCLGLERIHHQRRAEKNFEVRGRHKDPRERGRKTHQGGRFQQ